MIKISNKGDFSKTYKFFKGISRGDMYRRLDAYGRKGVEALASATPVDTGVTANSWSYEIKKYKHGLSITWINSNLINGIPIVVLLQYGHATRNGGFVEGRDFINPAIQPIFDQIAESAWKEVTKL